MEYDGNLDPIIEHVRKAFQELLSEDKIFQTMNAYAALEHNRAVKLVPWC